jgi:transposase
VTAADNRLFIEAVLYRYRTGMPRRDLTERFGDGTKVHLRFSGWAKAVCGSRWFQNLAADELPHGLPVAPVPARTQCSNAVTVA